MFSAVGADYDARYAVCKAEDYAEEGHKAVDYYFGVEGTETHSSDTDESEETNCD